MQNARSRRMIISNNMNKWAKIGREFNVRGIISYGISLSTEVVSKNILIQIYLLLRKSCRGYSNSYHQNSSQLFCCVIKLISIRDLHSTTQLIIMSSQPNGLAHDCHQLSTFYTSFSGEFLLHATTRLPNYVRHRVQTENMLSSSHKNAAERSKI